MRIICFFFLLISTISTAQIRATTESGDKVILNLDGTWIYDDTKPEQFTGECFELIQATTDKFSKQTTVSLQETIAIATEDEKKAIGVNMSYYGKGQFGLHLVAIKDGISPCVEESARIDILFRDQQTAGLSNSRKYNCDGIFSCFFGGLWGKRKILDDLALKEIETIRAWTSQGAVQVDLSPYQSQVFKKAINCLISESQ